MEHKCSFCDADAIADFHHSVLGIGSSCAEHRRRLDLIVGAYDWLPYPTRRVNDPIPE